MANEEEVKKLARARAYEDGNGVPQDKAKAMELYRSVAAAVTVAPTFMIGGCFGGMMWDGFIFNVMSQTDENNAYDMTRRGYPMNMDSLVLHRIKRNP